MSEAEPNGSFWKSLGGILTGIAAIMTAVAGLISVWYQWIEPTADPPGGRVDRSPLEATGDGDEPARGALESATIAAAEATPAGKIAIGDAVFAEWRSDGCLYPGDVQKIENGRYLVYFGFDAQVWIAPDGLIKPISPTAADVTPGTRVYAEVEDVRTKLIPSTVKDVRDGRYYLVFDEAAQCLPSGKGHVWLGVDRIVMLQ